MDFNDLVFPQWWYFCELFISCWVFGFLLFLFREDFFRKDKKAKNTKQFLSQTLNKQADKLNCISQHSLEHRKPILLFPSNSTTKKYHERSLSSIEIISPEIMPEIMCCLLKNTNVALKSQLIMNHYVVTNRNKILIYFFQMSGCYCFVFICTWLPNHNGNKCKVFMTIFR